MDILIKSDLPFAVGDKPIAKLVVSAIGFAAYSRAMTQAAVGAKDSAHVSRNLFRERIKAQVSAIGVDGKPVAWDDTSIGAVPARYAIVIKEAITQVFADKSGKPEVLFDGDGSTSAIHVKLGSPLLIGKDNEGKTRHVAELEFLATTLSQLEEVLAADNKMDRTIALLNLAKPVGSTLQSLPSVAHEQLTLADGIFLMERVTERFFLLPEDTPS